VSGSLSHKKGGPIHQFSASLGHDLKIKLLLLLSFLGGKQWWVLKRRPLELISEPLTIAWAFDNMT
jgi:hypothetical protein